MKTKIALTALTICASLLGCAVQQTPRTSTGWTQADIDAAIAEANRRCAVRAADPKIDPIRQYIPIQNPDSATLQQIASKRKPNAREKDAIVALDAAVSDCRQELLDIDTAAGISVDPRHAANFKQLSLDLKQAKAQLWSGQVSYGQYIEISAASRKKWSDRQQEISDGIRASEVQQAQAAALQQQAAAQALMLFNRASYQYRQPVQTNCVKIGGQTSCTSY